MREIYAAVRDQKAFYCALVGKTTGCNRRSHDNEASLYRFSRKMASGQSIDLSNCRVPMLPIVESQEQGGGRVPIMPVDEARLNAFMEKFVHDIGAVMHAATVVLGDELYRG